MSIPFAFSAVNAEEARKITGIDRVRGSSLSRLITSNPSQVFSRS